jgi:SAM-dependent methyltransferase
MTTQLPDASTAPANDTVETFDPAMFELLFEAEDKHFWFRARNEAITCVVREALRAQKTDERAARILEIGCGTGNVLRALEEAFPEGDVCGMDLFEEGLRYARRRVKRASIVKADATKLTGENESYDVIGMFDVLEHLPDDADVLSRVVPLLKPGAACVVTVPAHMALWSYFDELSDHQRRYSAGSLRAVLSGAGLEVEYLTEYMATMYPLMWLSRRLRGSKRPGGTLDARQRLQLAHRELKVSPVLNEVLYGVLHRENRRLARREQLPFGTSLIAVARRR